MVKASSGLWVQMSEIQTQIQKKFSLRLCHAENNRGVVRVYWAGDKVLAAQLAEHIEKSLGLPYELVDLKAAGSLKSLLQNSQKKSSVEAFREWYEVQKCS